MNGLLKNIRLLVNTIKQHRLRTAKTQVAICPPCLYIPELASLLKDSAIELGAQNVSHFKNGAYTGEISASMLQDFNCRYVIIGHSERRAYHGEDNVRIAEKIIAVQSENMIPILCVGEQLAERQADITEKIIAEQLNSVIEIAGIKAFNNLVIAYEPVWAIGTGKTATPEQAQQVHAFIRLCLARHRQDIAANIKIIYGGSVNADNAATLFTMKDINGGLIGGASLIADDFLAICQSMG